MAALVVVGCLLRDSFCGRGARWWRVLSSARLRRDLKTAQSGERLEAQATFQLVPSCEGTRSRTMARWVVASVEDEPDDSWLLLLLLLLVVVVVVLLVVVDDGSGPASRAEVGRARAWA